MPHRWGKCNAAGLRPKGGGNSRRLSHLRWMRREAAKEGRSLSPFLPRVASSVVIREAAPSIETITIDDSPSTTPSDQRSLQEAVTPRPHTSPPIEVFTPPPISPFQNSLQNPSLPVPSSIPPWPGVVEILDTGSATGMPDISELTPEFLRWFNDLYQGGYDLTYILDHSDFLENLEYSYPPF